MFGRKKNNDDKEHDWIEGLVKRAEELEKGNYVKSSSLNKNNDKVDAQIKEISQRFEELAKGNYIKSNSLNTPYTQRIPEKGLGDQGKVTNPFEYDVFICHSSKDKSVIEVLIEDFKEYGVTYWVDAEQINFGDQITQKIEEGLKKSKYIIPCLSKNLNTSGWTRAEYSSILNAEFSGNSRRIIIPLKLDNCEYDDIPFLLRDIRRVTYSNRNEFYEFIEFLKNKK